MNTQLANKVTIDSLLAVAKKLNHKVFTGDKNYNLNIWVIRADNQKAGSFDDIEAVWWKHNGIWFMYKYAVTADPSDLALIKHSNPLGTAIVLPGQYPGLWKSGLHKGQYSALVQNTPVTVIRDFNGNGILDYNVPKVYDHTKIYRAKGQDGLVTDYYLDDEIIFRTHTGMFGINNHRASQWQILETIGLYSEGCCTHQVPAKYKEFINITDKANAIYNSSFTGTYITEDEL